MRVCMLNITSGGMSGGYRNYLSKLVPRLAAHPQVEALLVGAPEPKNLCEPEGAASSIEWLPLKCSLAARGREVSRAQKKTVERFAPDVVFVPTARYWSLDGVPAVNMVRNMMPATPYNSRYCLERLRNWARFRQMRKAVSHSNRVIAISQFVKEYLICGLGLPAERIGVVYHGTDLHRELRARKPNLVPDDWAGRFVFTAGLIYPYRGLEDLIGAWCHLRGSPNLPPLVIAGKVGQGMSRYYASLRRLVCERGLDDHIHFVGLLTRPEMTWCYGNCSAFVMTSRVEACPNIALEAMANGSLCISTASPPLPEMFGRAAWYYPANESRILAERIREVLRLPRDRGNAARACAIARAGEFSWDTCCRRTVEELQKAIEGSQLQEGANAEHDLSHI